MGQHEIHGEIFGKHTVYVGVDFILLHLCWVGSVSQWNWWNWAPQAPPSWGPRIPTISPHFELSNVEHAGVAIQRQWACRGPHKPSSWRTGHNLRRAEQLEDWECIIDVMELWMCWSKTTSLNRAGNRNTLWGCCDASWIWLLVTFGMLR